MIFLYIIGSRSADLLKQITNRVAQTTQLDFTVLFLITFSVKIYISKCIEKWAKTPITDETNPSEVVAKLNSAGNRINLLLRRVSSL